jgi:hypothetical protein
MILIRKQAAMASQIRKRRERSAQADQTGPPEPTKLKIGIALRPLPQENTAQGSCPLAGHHVHQQLVPEATATTVVEPEDVLIADARDGVTPAQMVEQKLRALLDNGHARPTGRPEDIRRRPVARSTPTSAFRTTDNTLE